VAERKLNMNIIGIDPGQTGAIAFLKRNMDLEEVTFFDMPTSGKHVDPILITHIIMGQGLSDIRLCGIEDVHSMPKQGVASSFKFGRSLGVVEGVIGALLIPYQMVRPQEWKKHYGLIRKEKDESRRTALKLYPTYAEELKRKKDIGRAEALLIARYVQDKIYKEM